MNQRSLEFRVWRFCHAENKHKFYYTSSPQVVMNSGATLVFPTDGNLKWVDDCLMNPGEDIKITQFTGLLDKNGVKIYEGDILKGSNGVLSKVYFNNCHAAFKKIVGNDLDKFIDIANTRNSEIIGNIFENGDLIK